MSSGSELPTETRIPVAAPPPASAAPVSPTAIQIAPPPAPTPPIPTPHILQLSDRPVHEVFAIAEELGLKPRQFKTRQQLISAIHARRQVIVSLNRDAMVDVLRWARRTAPPGASKETLAHEIISIKTMRFAGLSQRGLVVIAALRGLDVTGDEPVPKLVRKLKKQESFFAKINRARRSMLGSMVSKIIGGETVPLHQSETGEEAHGAASPSIKHDIEEAGLFGGLAGRIKKSADSYVNQKLDEIEARIDRKLDEIDRRLAEWRDKEVANRIRILKITLWASVVVGVFSLMYSYVQIYLRH
ncbi:MAG: hypothetical protein JO353_09515 [Phycisphaerae bacterium]|nr:hypothetical protein [Phycisphaerae bacterium]